MVELFSILKEKESVEIPKILSTHPVTKDRIAFSEKLVAKKDYTPIKDETLEKLFEDLKKD
jgi:predicted Zn-dependent protease